MPPIMDDSLTPKPSHKREQPLIRTLFKGLENGLSAYDPAVMDWATPKPVPQRVKGNETKRSSSFSSPSDGVVEDNNALGLARRSTSHEIFGPGETPLTARPGTEIHLNPYAFERARSNTSANIIEHLTQEQSHALNTLTAEKRSNSWSALVKQSSQSIFSRKGSDASSGSDSAYGSEALQQPQVYKRNSDELPDIDRSNTSGTNGYSSPVSIAAVAPLKPDTSHLWQGGTIAPERDPSLSRISPTSMMTTAEQQYLLKSMPNQYDNSMQTSQGSTYTAITLPQGYPSQPGIGGHTVYVPNQQSQQMLLITQQPTLSNTGSMLVDTSLSPQDVNKWEALVKAKDSMLRQKDQMIEKQKKAISELQQRQLDQDTRMLQAVRAHSQSQDDMLTLKLQELQFENGQLRGQLADIATKKESEVGSMRNKLGEREYEIQRLEEKFKALAAEQSKEISILREKLSEREKHASDLSCERESSKDKEKELRHEVDKLNAYLNNLPTLEEHKKVCKELREIKDDYKKYKEVATAQQKKIADLKRVLSSKSSTAKKLEEEKKELQDKNQHLEKAVDSYKKGGAVSELEVEEAKWETERIKTELDRCKKLLENKHKKMKELHDQSQATQKNLEERLAQEEDTVNALRTDLQSKDEKLEELRKSMKKLASQNQDLMEVNMNLEDTCKEYEKANSKEVTEAQKRLYFELTLCMSDLKSLMELCSSRREGEDPSMSALLGLRRPSVVEFAENLEQFNPSTDALTEINSKLESLQNIRLEVDNLRSFISDKYAEDIGEQCHVQ